MDLFIALAAFALGAWMIKQIKGAGSSNLMKAAGSSFDFLAGGVSLAVGILLMGGQVTEVALWLATAFAVIYWIGLAIDHTSLPSRLLKSSGLTVVTCYLWTVARLHMGNTPLVWALNTTVWALFVGAGIYFYRAGSRMATTNAD